LLFTGLILKEVSMEILPDLVSCGFHFFGPLLLQESMVGMRFE
jgi:hypothetical protein